MIVFVVGIAFVVVFSLAISESIRHRRSRSGQGFVGDGGSDGDVMIAADTSSDCGDAGGGDGGGDGD